MALTELQVRKAQPQAKAYKLYDEKGLFILIKQNGGKYWRFKYKFGGKENSLPLGVYPEITLKEARQRRDDARQQINENIDPAQNRKVEKLLRDVSKDDSFQAVTEEWHSNNKHRWQAKHSRRILRYLSADFFPKIGSRPIGKLTAPELLAVLREVEKRDAVYVAHRLRAWCSEIFRYAIATGKADQDIAANLRGALRARNPKHFARLEEKELPELLKAVSLYDGEEQTRRALTLLHLTFVRTTELRGARWLEFDIEKAIWEIPPGRMKMKEKHIVPLSTQALEVLKAQREFSGHCEFVFPNANRPQSFMSENTMLYAYYRMGYHGRATPHGIRATASTILNEHGFNKDHVERQLAHADRDDVRATYNYAQYLPERRQMMQWWANYLETVASRR